MRVVRSVLLMVGVAIALAPPIAAAQPDVFRDKQIKLLIGAFPGGGYGGAAGTAAPPSEFAHFQRGNEPPGGRL
jgi:hypothetical protein